MARCAVNIQPESSRNKSSPEGCEGELVSSPVPQQEKRFVALTLRNTLSEIYKEVSILKALRRPVERNTCMILFNSAFLKIT